ncbi:TAXI family TRAP transporter solute-binding subunit [Bacillus sp. MRMR6]|uniref:TAXI family TRAP transporter solute-binding subunit n=1 Tax=Bacillus sp. MRMR6 TaxID=1928617 RepID=UPI0009513CE7|nr:TAXI family TRAP transporter solute-binding subunit [Bacillus sp. MRMR6]OLS33865.1 hypothetical protein BTR25_23680 [Bacillus sp. MRMR6]
MKKGILFPIFLVLMLVLLAACGSETGSGSTDEGTSKNTGKKEFVTIAAGSSGGTYYLIGSGIVSQLNKYESNITANSEVTNGTAENIGLLGSDSVNFGIILADVAYRAQNGLSEYEGKAQDNLRIIMKGHPNDLQIVVLEDSGINSMSDLRGKRVSLAYGLPDLTAEILETADGLVRDKDYKSEILPFNDAISAMKDGHIDAITFLSGKPVASISDISATHDIKILPVSKEEQKKVTDKYSYFETSVVEAGTYQGQDTEIPTLKISAFLLTNEEVSEDLVYKVTKSVLEYPGEFSNIHSAAKYWTLPEAAKGFHIPAHPGAIKYYKEKGIEIE